MINTITVSFNDELLIKNGENQNIETHRFWLIIKH